MIFTPSFLPEPPAMPMIRLFMFQNLRVPIVVEKIPRIGYNILILHNNTLRSVLTGPNLRWEAF